MMMSVEQLVECLAGEPKYLEKPCPSADLSTTTPTWSDQLELGPPRWEAND
jgi:hypothetical protein